ncbi:hypothetical protein P170DRAFT_476729 [Aspergillus steynii IBT 23096]|uniref:Uncharacterized protein n=1 Tax=Aspergillus steynii IBT 23096 TaxID=1392250 RepID=A0A2I2G5C4_9EURO|nr:uncharacterized protein P170DRAFT_476729 [Aspergillus steynii IBT 23096]PLB48082.1 hypothetical protein P170DRAFT_476729 [Aspergillus steynii IBT 23096]
MPPEISPVPLSSPRTRPRAATATQPTTSSSASSRRPSQAMGPPALSLGPSDQETVREATGPLRHPKPLTPSDLHSMLEQEQEAMVNRLSRELSSLRQQTASVASTTSSASTSFNDPVDALHTSPHLINTAHPTASRRHRSSSSLSSSYVPAVQGSRAGSVAGIAPSREVGLASPRPGDPMRPGRSREPSLTSSRPSEGVLSSFSPSSSQHLPYQSLDQSSHFPNAPTHGHRSSLSQQRSRTTSTASRPDEIAHQRAELEVIRRENDALRRRVRELESTLKKQRENESTTTTTISTASGTSALTDGLRKASLTDTRDDQHS